MKPCGRSVDGDVLRRRRRERRMHSYHCLGPRGAVGGERARGGGDLEFYFYFGRREEVNRRGKGRMQHRREAGRRPLLVGGGTEADDIAEGAVDRGPGKAGAGGGGEGYDGVGGGDGARRGRRGGGDGKRGEAGEEGAGGGEGGGEGVAELVVAEGVGVEAVVGCRGGWGLGRAVRFGSVKSRQLQWKLTGVVFTKRDVDDGGGRGGPLGNGVGEERVVLVGQTREGVAAKERGAMRDVGNGELEARIYGAGPGDELPHAGQGVARPADAPGQIVEAELDETQVGLELGDLLGHEVLGLLGLPATDSKVAAAGEEFGVDALRVPAIAARPAAERGVGVGGQGRGPGRVGVVGRHGAVVRADELGRHAVEARPLPQTVVPGPVALAAVRDGVADNQNARHRLHGGVVMRKWKIQVCQLGISLADRSVLFGVFFSFFTFGR